MSRPTTAQLVAMSGEQMAAQLMSRTWTAAQFNEYMTERDKALAAAAAGENKEVKVVFAGVFEGKPMIELTGPFRPLYMGAAKLQAIISAAPALQKVLDNPPSAEELEALRVARDLAFQARKKGKKAA